MIEFARELVSISSVSHNEGTAARRCADEMEKLGFRVEVDQLGNVLGVVGSGPQRLLIDGHIDTVAPNPGWTRNPYEPSIENGRLYGLGSVDMKGSVAAAIYGVAQAARRNALPGTVGVSVTTLEEVIEGATIAAVVDRFEPTAVVIAEPTDLKLALSQKGRAELFVDVVGRAAHAAQPDQGANALLGAAAVLTALAARKDPTDPELGAGILVVTEGITEPQPGISVVPGLCRLRFDRRLLPGETAASVLDELKPFLQAARNYATTATARLSEGIVTTYTGYELTAKRFLPPWRLHPSHPFAVAARRALDGALGSIVIAPFPACTNGSLTAGMRGIPTIIFGPGPTGGAHQADESVATDDLERSELGFSALASTHIAA
jgi:putative selenium metabolism hydrolase